MSSSSPLIASCADDIRIWTMNEDARGGTVQTTPMKQFSPHHTSRVSCICWNHNSDSSLPYLIVVRP